ncbi:MAG: Asp23/Gls24 family envelope stress response protein [Oscillospiraceae bacterium]|nr:Asp23/Gls24 family envelope stress response protein [Oscillospiraceae bacterium]
MAEPKIEVDDRLEQNHSLSFDEKVLKKIAGIAASEISGVLAISGTLFSGITDRLKSADDPTKGISVEVGKKQVAVEMKVVCEYGRNIPEIFQSIVSAVSTGIKEMTGLEVVDIKVHVADVLLKQDFERKKKVALSKELDPDSPADEVEATEE